MEKFKNLNVLRNYIRTKVGFQVQVHYGECLNIEWGDCLGTPCAVGMKKNSSFFIYKKNYFICLCFFLFMF